MPREQVLILAQGLDAATGWTSPQVRGQERVHMLRDEQADRWHEEVPHYPNGRALIEPQLDQASQEVDDDQMIIYASYACNI